jgi:hypothetical protein
MMQTILSEQEANWKLVISKLVTKLNKSHELYGFCVDMLKMGGSTFQRKLLLWFTLSLLWNQSRAKESSPLLWQVCTPAHWIYPTRAAAWAVLLMVNFSTSRSFLAMHIFQTGVLVINKCN